MKGLMVAAPRSGAGKTLLTMMILRGLQQRGIMIAPFKAGPDYIDRHLHHLACGQISTNLDLWGMRPQLVDHLAMRAAVEGKTLIVEAMMGLFDGALDGSASPADLARRLKLPVVLIVDCRKMTHSIAALVSGFHHFVADVPLRGLILNKIASLRHELMLRQALDKLDIPILGAVASHKRLVIEPRHLGLTLPENLSKFEDFIEEASQLIAPQLDWESLIKMADEGAVIEERVVPMPRFTPLGQHIAIAHDSAFCFTYPHLLSSWYSQGCQISFFSPLGDEPPPVCADSIYLPGGYPELYAGQLATNSHFRAGMQQAAASGKCIYGECGGFMVLGERLEDKEGNSHAMLNLLPVTTSIKRPRLTLGYRKLRSLSDFLLPIEAHGHEFHYSCIVHQGEAQPLFQMRDALDTDLGVCGLVRGSVAGSFIHLIDEV